MNINIPVNDKFQDDFRRMLASVAQEVIQEVKVKETKAKDYMTIKETQEYLQISFGTLQKWQQLGLKSITIEGKRLFKKSTIDEFMRGFEE